MQRVYGNDILVTQLTIYRGSGYAFSVDPEFMHVSTSSKYWDDVNEKFYNKYFGLDNKHQEWAEQVVKGLPIEGPLGRSWKLEMSRDMRSGQLKIPWTTLTNYPTQGTGADIMAIARVMAFRRIKALGIPCKFLSTVHDSIVVDLPTEYLQQVVDLFSKVFDDLQASIWKLYKYEWKTPLACECKYGTNLGNQTKIVRSI